MSIKHPTYDEHWQRIQDRMTEIIEACPIKVFLASFTWEAFVPFRLVNVNTIRKAPIEHSTELILDSGVRDDTVTNQQVIDCALKYEEGVDWVLPKDYPNDRERTVESVLDFFKRAPDSVKAKVIVPLQGVDGPDYLRCWREIQQGAGLSDDTYVAFGGIAGSDITRVASMRTTQQKKVAVQHLLDNSEVRIHLLGQTNFGWTEMYQHERIVSCDSAKFGHSVHYTVPRGEGGQQLHAWHEMSDWFEFCMKISPGHLPQGKKPKQHEFGEFFG